MDQTLTVWETQTARETVHFKENTVSCLLCDLCDYLLFYLLDQTNVDVFDSSVYVGICKGWKWKRLAI